MFHTQALGTAALVWVVVGHWPACCSSSKMQLGKDKDEPDCREHIPSHPSAMSCCQLSKANLKILAFFFLVLD